MSTNYVGEGNVIKVTLTAAQASGQALLIGTLLGVAITAGNTGDTINFAIEEAFTLPKVAATAITQGAALYWDNAAKNLTTTAAGNTLVGTALAAAAAADTTVLIKLKGR